MWLVGLSLSCQQCALHTAPRIPQSLRLSLCSQLGVGSWSGAAAGACNPQRIYHQGLQGADNLHTSAKLPLFAAEPQAPGRTKSGMRAAAKSSSSSLVACRTPLVGHSIPPSTRALDKDCSLVFHAESQLCGTFLPIESSWQALGRKHVP